MNWIATYILVATFFAGWVFGMKKWRHFWQNLIVSAVVGLIWPIPVISGVYTGLKSRVKNI